MAESVAGMRSSARVRRLLRAGAVVSIIVGNLDGFFSAGKLSAHRFKPAKFSCLHICFLRTFLLYSRAYEFRSAIAPRR